MRLKRIACLALAAVLALPLAAAPADSYAAARFTDTAGHWAENYINTAVNKKIITGYPDGKFLPDKAVTRAEFATMVNKALGNAGTATISFTDVYYGEWYYNDVAKALAAAYTAGYDDNTFRPNSPITRQEAAVMISRIVPVYGAGGNIRAYADYGSIADWAYGAVEKVNGKGYIGAYSDGKIHPVDQLTRAQTAKILCDILDHETVVTANTTVDEDGTKLSGKIYANNVIIDKDLGEDSATIDNCVILGSLSVKGGGTDTITVSNSRVADAAVDKGSDPVRILAKGETSISRLSASQSSILQTSGLSGGLFGPGFSNITVNGSAELTLRGSFPKVNVSGTRAKVTLDTGTIDALTVGGRYSDITAESGTTINTATVNTESYFHGTGTVSQMNVNADNITYETKPKHWTIASSAETPTASDETGDITYSPKNGATNVKLDTKITITFDSAMEMYDGTSISSSDIEDFVELRKSSSTGSQVAYSASINSAKTVITITPDSVLSKDTKYYVIIDKNSIRDSHDNGNTAQSIYFTTGEDTENVTTTYSPANGATTVPVNTGITITFSDDVVKYSGGGTISTSDSYLDGCIVFKKTNSSGSTVPCDVTISSSKKVITIAPDSSLTLDQKYYVAVVANKLKTKDGGDAVPASSVTWTTGVTTPVVNSFTVSPGDTSISATMTPNVAGRLYAIVLPAGSAAPAGAQVAAGQNSTGAPALASAKNESAAAATAVTLPSMSGLASGTSYDVWATLYSTASGTYSTPVKLTATTTMPRITLDNLSVKPIVSSTEKDEQISFHSTTYNYSVSLNSSITNVSLNAQGDSAATITLSGNGIGTVTGPGLISTSVDIIANPSLSITISSAGKTSSVYTLSFTSADDASLSLIEVNTAPLAEGGGSYSYPMSTTISAVIELKVQTTDKYAAIEAPTGTDVEVVPAPLNGLGSASFSLKIPEGSNPVAVKFNVKSGNTTVPYIILFNKP